MRSPMACSPRTRGWSRGPGQGFAHRPVLPAHAGMVLHGSGDRTPPDSAPRARGDGPTSTPEECNDSPCSPRTRGWSRRPVMDEVTINVLPTHAGMVPVRDGTESHSVRAPRTRGGGPEYGEPRAQITACSPHARGWPVGPCDGAGAPWCQGAGSGTSELSVGGQEGQKSGDLTTFSGGSLRAADGAWPRVPATCVGIRTDIPAGQKLDTCSTVFRWSTRRHSSWESSSSASSSSRSS